MRTAGRSRQSCAITTATALVYPSVRDEGGSCVAAFWPDVAGVPMQERHLQYEWDGKRFSRWFDYKLETWSDL